MLTGNRLRLVPAHLVRRHATRPEIAGPKAPHPCWPPSQRPFSPDPGHEKEMYAPCLGQGAST